MTADALDSRCWLAWGLAAMTPVLLGRNPWVLLEVMIIVVVVRVVWLPRANQRGMGWFLRIAAVFTIVGVHFNVLTVHAGDRPFGSLPNAWPVIGGDLTWNALLYGVVSGFALFTLVLIGITVSSQISWLDLVYSLPARLAPIAVTGSVAWAFLPQTAIAWQQIREAQTMRGHSFRTVRDFVPIVVPLLAGGLERSLVIAETLESRGFGASGQSRLRDERRTRSLFADLGMIIGLVAIAAAAYCAAVGLLRWALVSFGVGILGLFTASRLAATQKVMGARYRTIRWSSADTIVTVSSAVGALFVMGWNIVRPESLGYRVYPDLAAPQADIVLMLALGLLLVPAFAPGGEGRR